MMKQFIKSMLSGAATAYLAVAAPISATEPDAGKDGTIIRLYAVGAVPPLGVPEVREDMPEAGGLLVRNVSDPALEMFDPAPERATGTAVIIAPGGGFVGLSYEAEGTAVARALAQQGVTAFVLKYRTIASGDDPLVLPEIHAREMELIMARAATGHPVEVPEFAGEANALADAQRAMVIVRQRASEWGLDPQKVGFLGFSAGGYLAADLAIGNAAMRPDFVGMIYGGLRTPVLADASAAFIAAASDDAFQPNDAVMTYEAWREAGAAAELHVYERGGHGFGMKSKGTTSDDWFLGFLRWMQSRGLLQQSDVGHGQQSGEASQ